MYGTFLLKSKWRLGGFYSLKEMAGVIAELQVTDKLNVGYSFDVSVNELIATNLGSHELGVSYIMRSFRKRVVYPRRF
jgi:hypothetical protein